MRQCGCLDLGARSLPDACGVSTVQIQTGTGTRSVQSDGGFRLIKGVHRASHSRTG